MQSQATQIFFYKPNVEQYRKRFIQPVLVQNFSKISAKQIEQQFEVLNSARLTSNNLLYTNKTDWNRYVNILVYQHNRLRIPQNPKFYVNASKMKSVVDGKQFAIFCQAPVPNFANFWQAMHFQQVDLIIMLCMFNDPRRGRQADKYWPQLGKTLIIQKQNLKISNIQEKIIDDDFKLTKLSLKYDNQPEKIINHYHWYGWSDMKAPSEHVLHILEQLIQITLKHAQKNGKMVIHCSAGIGRTGTLAAIVEGIRCINKNKKLSVFNIIENFRKYRSGCIQTQEQYFFIYQYLNSYIKKNCLK